MSTSMADLADILKRRDIKTLHYFHADHYEPWSLGLNETTATGVDRFGEMTRSSRFGSRMSLFYSCFVPYNLDVTNERSASSRRVGRDAVAFFPRSDAQEELARKTICPLFESGRHELHLHVHHEFWTRNDSHFESEVSKWVNAHSNAEMDRDRLDLFFSLCREVIEREVGTSFDRWAFVHGNWALAASDPLICTIENELGMIMRHGGWGDFSFPAGRGYCDPRLELPFTCNPIDGQRPYDDPASDPRPLASGSRVLGPERFFIWNSPIKAQYSSLDYYSESNRDLFRDSGRMLNQWLTNSVAFGSDLFVKTHAHSMKWEYEIFKPDSRIPHLYPDVVNIFEDLLRVCDRAGVEFRPVTVNQVMETLGAFDQEESVKAQPKTATAPPGAAPAPAGKAVDSAKAGTTSVERRRAPRQTIGLDKVAALDTYLMTNLRKWVEEDPGRSEGAGTFYLELLKGNQLLQDYERAVLEYLVAETKPEETTVLEVGIGYGILSLMLAAVGFEVVASEGSRPRLDGFEFLLDSLGKSVPGIVERVRPLYGWFPDSFDPTSLAKDRRNVLVATNIVATATAERQEAIIEVARSFDDLVIDTTRFGLVRYDSAVAEELHRAIATHCKPVTAVWRRAPNEIWHYQPERAGAEVAPQPSPPLVTAAAAQPSRPVVEPASQPLPPVVAGVTTLDGFGRELLDMQRAWMAGEGSSLPHDDLYAAKIARGISLEAHEVALASAMAERFEPAATEIVEIGYGQGALSLFLGRQGYSVHGYEGDRRRATAAASHLRKQAERHPGLSVSFSGGFFPDAAALPAVDAGKRRICIATNITCTYTDTHREAILDAVARLDEFIFDLGRFGRNRNSQEERDELRDELVGRGFEAVERLHFAAPYEYWRFRAPVSKAAAPDAGARSAAVNAPAAQPSVAAAPQLSPALVTGAAPQPSPPVAEPASQPLPPVVAGVTTLDGFGRELLDMQRAWMAGEGSSLPHDDLYAAKIARGISLEAHEVALASAMAERFEPAATEIVEIGYGQGALSLFLGRQGYSVHGYEGDRRRATAAASHLRKQAERHPGLSVSFSGGFFPDAAALPAVDAGKRRICIATNITCTYTDTHREAILDAVARLDEFIFDLGRFGRNRNSQEERDELRDELVGRGFEAVERLHFAAPYEYWRFRAPVSKAVAPDAGARSAAVNAPAAQPSVAAAPTEARPEPAAWDAGEHGLFPIRDDAGTIFSIFGDKRLDGCPLCGGHATAQLWRMPMSNLSQPINAFGGYYHQAPSLHTPGTVYCFDFCRDCHSIYLNPVAANRKQNYRTIEHQIRMMQDEVAWRGYDEVFERFARWMPDGGTIVDAACGVGQYLEIARKRSPGKWSRLVGLELSERYVAHMKQRNIDAHLFDLDSDSLDPIVRQASVDVAFFCEAFQYVEQPREVIRKLLRALKPGGRLCFTALRYGRDVQSGVRPSEPIYVGQKWLEGLAESLGCRVLDVEVSPMRYYVTLEK